MTAGATSARGAQGRLPLLRRLFASPDPGPDRRFLVPEYIQASAMDCGPYALAALCDGCGLPVRPGVLRDLCETGRDGTSLSALEDLAIELGLQCSQIMLPPDHVALPDFPSLPALCVTRHPDGFTHFVIAWRRHGSWLQIMDPAKGRLWVPVEKFRDELYRHKLEITAGDWLAFARSEAFLPGLHLRLEALLASEAEADSLLQAAVANGTGWRELAALDACTRMAERLRSRGVLRRGREARHLIRESLEEDAREVERAGTAFLTPAAIAPVFWSVLPQPGESAVPVEPDRLRFSAALVLSVQGITDSEEDREHHAILQDRKARTPGPERSLFRIAGKDRWFLPVLGLSAMVAGAGLLMEALALRALLEPPAGLEGTGQAGIAAGLVLGLLLVEQALAGTGGFLGRRLETALRLAFQSKLPSLGEAFFSTRLPTDISRRAFEIRRLRLLPGLLGNSLKTVATLLFVAAGLAFLLPEGLFLATVFLLLNGLAIFLVRPVLEPGERREQALSGSLLRFTHDALRGVSVLRAHGAGTAVSRAYETLLTAWARSGQDSLVRRTRIAACLFAGNSFAAIWMMFHFVQSGGESAAALVLLFLCMRFGELGQGLFVLMRQYPRFRTMMARLTEPLDAEDELAVRYAPDLPEDDGKPVHSADGSPERVRDAAAISLEGATLISGGQVILGPLDLEILPGEHIAIVGTSGAGKSTLLQLLTGLQSPQKGAVRVNGRLLQAEALLALRRATVWIDPEIRLWNRSVGENIQYGQDLCPEWMQQEAMLAAGIPDTAERQVGESGRLLSGGEGQRVRLARGFAHMKPRLVLLDEPFRGLERSRREELLRECRTRWQGATLLFVSHDVQESSHFDRVLVLEQGQGQIVEQGPPKALLTRKGRYFDLIKAAEKAEAMFDPGKGWRCLTLQGGVLQETRPEQRQEDPDDQ